MTSGAPIENLGPDEIGHAAKEITLLPNDRLVRSVLLIIGLAWWCDQGIAFMREATGTMLLIALPVFITVTALGVFLLIWLAAGVEILVVREGVLHHERRIAIVRVWPTRVYPLVVIKDLRVEERVFKIKGNKSRRFELVFNDAFGRRGLVWRRSRMESDELVRRLRDAITAQLPAR